MILTTAALCLAMNIYQEARGEPIPGQYAVAQVTMNRAKKEENVCSVVMAQKQFSWTTKLVKREGQTYVMTPRGIPKDADAWKKAKIIAATVLSGRIGVPLAEGTTHYHSLSVMPHWALSYRPKAVIGHHIFYTTA